MKLLTTKQVARLYGVKPDTVRKWVSEGRMDREGKITRLSVKDYASRGIKLFHPEAVAEFVRCTQPPAESLTYKDATEIAGVAISTFSMWICRGLRMNGGWVKLPVTKYGQEVAISRNDLEWFLNLRRKERERRQAAIDARLDAVIQRRRATMPAGEGRVRNEKRKPAGKGRGE